jgi:hypothetical protein
MVRETVLHRIWPGRFGLKLFGMIIWKNDGYVHGPTVTVTRHLRVWTGLKIFGSPTGIFEQ